MKYPIGIQNFESLIKDGFFYVDKTALVHRLVTSGRYYFLSRPRRVGKSLLLSTFRATFEGKKEFDLALGKILSEFEGAKGISPITMIDRFPLSMDKMELQKRYGLFMEAIDGLLKVDIKYRGQKGNVKNHVITLDVKDSYLFMVKIRHIVSIPELRKISKSNQ